jgi:hypothetical protein
MIHYKLVGDEVAAVLFLPAQALFSVMTSHDMREGLDRVVLCC